VVIMRALFGDLAARIPMASRDGLREENHRVERVARTVRDHGSTAGGRDKPTGLPAEIPIRSLSLTRIGFTNSWVNAASVSRGEAIHANACRAKLQSKTKP
jgi:hypothetical protein